MVDLLTAHRHTKNNRAEIEASTRCGCFYCQQIFPPEDIVGWAGLDFSNFEDPDAQEGGTALCPHCGSEAVIGDKSGLGIDTLFLSQMNEAWFQKTIIRKPKPKT